MPSDFAGAAKGEGKRLTRVVNGAGFRGRGYNDCRVFSRGAVTVIGNEGNGVSNEVKAFSDRFITIPMGGKAESLNASAAATITMWEMMK